MPSQVVAAADGVVWDAGSTCTYHGFTLRETASAEALVYVRETSATGKILDVIAFAADQAVADWYDTGRACNGDLYFDLDAGTVEGSVFVS